MEARAARVDFMGSGRGQRGYLLLAAVDSPFLLRGSANTASRFLL